MSGNWDIVGGRIDPGSKLIDNLRREVMEKTQLVITSEPVLIAAQDIISNPEKHVVRLSYSGKTSGEPKLDTSENIEYRWLTIEEIGKMEDLDIYVAEIIQKGLLK